MVNGTGFHLTRMLIAKMKVYSVDDGLLNECEILVLL